MFWTHFRLQAFYLYSLSLCCSTITWPANFLLIFHLTIFHFIFLFLNIITLFVVVLFCHVKAMYQMLWNKLNKNKTVKLWKNKQHGKSMKKGREKVKRKQKSNIKSFHFCLFFFRSFGIRSYLLQRHNDEWDNTTTHIHTHNKKT